MSIIRLGEDIPAGLEYIATELQRNRSACWVGKGPAGFALLTGSKHPKEVLCGKIIAISLTPALLRQLHARIGELLADEKSVPIDGIKIGGPLSG